eukprot:13480619-Ditylum_brightwellii.AAC.1
MASWEKNVSDVSFFERRFDAHIYKVQKDDEEVVEKSGIEKKMLEKVERGKLVVDPWKSKDYKN